LERIHISVELGDFLTLPALNLTLQIFFCLPITSNESLMNDELAEIPQSFTSFKARQNDGSSQVFLVYGT
jgi:hypothetical protein